MTIDWNNKLIFIPKSDLTLVQGSVYKLDLNQFKADLGDIMDNSDGIVNDTIYLNNPPFELDGVTYARGLKIINGYKVEFEDGQYAVNLIGANSNVASVSVVNQVSIRPFNSAGLQIVTVAESSALTPEEHDAVMASSSKADVDAIPEAVWEVQL